MSRAISIAAVMLLTIVLIMSSFSPSFAQSERILLLIHGSGDEVVQLPEIGTDDFLVARIHGNPLENHFAVTSYDKYGEYVELLANTTESYAGIVPFNFDAYDMYDLSEGVLEVQAEGPWSIEVIALGDMLAAESNQMIGGYGDYTGYVKGNSSTAIVYGNEAGRHFAVFAIGVRSGQAEGDLLVNTTSLYNGRVRMPRNETGFILIVKSADAWAIGFDDTDTDEFDSRTIALKAGPNSPFYEEAAEPIAAPPTAAANSTPAPAAAGSSTGTVNRDANLRSGPGTNYAIAGSAKNGQVVKISGTNPDGSWLQLSDGKWIAAFLVNRAPVASSTATPAPAATKSITPTTTTLAPTATAVSPTSTPNKAVYWGDMGVQKCGDFEWRVADVRRSKDAWFYDKHQVAQGEFAIFYVEVKNVGKEVTRFWETDPTMPGKTFSERGSQYAAWMMTGGFNTLWEEVDPGEFITLVGAYDVAPDTHTYTFGALACNQIVEVGSWFELERGAIKASN